VIHIAEKWEFDADLLGESSVRGRTIHAYTENFRIIRIDLARVDSRLDRLELFGSTTCEGQDVNSQKDIFLSVKIAEFDGLPLVAEQSKVRGRIANFK
jgi:hypothetical protein